MSATPIVPVHPLDKVRGHQLLTVEEALKLPPLYSQDGKGYDAIAQVKFFTPYAGWTWYATEGEAEEDEPGSLDWTFFGLVDGHEKEFGYFRWSELAGMNQNGLPLVERDCWWKPKALSEL